MMVDAYEKEGCLRMETDLLIVMGVTDKLIESVDYDWAWDVDFGF